MRLSGQATVDHVNAIATALTPTTLVSVRVGHVALLPVVLAAVLIHSSKGRLPAFVRQLLSEGSERDTWVLQNSKVGTCIIRPSFHPISATKKILFALRKFWHV